MRIPYPWDTDNFEPAYSQSASTYRMMWTLYNNIVKRDPNFNLVPDLAQSWELSADGKTMTFRLNKGIKFQDGTDLNAKAVKWNLDFILNKDNSSPHRSLISDGIQSVEAVDDNTLVIHMPKPYRPLLANLSDRPGWIISPAAKDKFGKDYGKNPVGSGPFKLKEWAVGSSITVVKNDGYWEKGLPYLDAIKFIIVPETSVQLAMLRTGEADFLEGMLATDVSLVERNPNLRVVNGTGARVWFLQLDVQKQPLDKKALRQAIAYGVDRQGVINAWLNGRGQVAYTTEGIGWWADPNIKPYSYDPQKAKAKLAEAGYASGVTLPYDCNSSTQEAMLCEIVQAQLKDLGINLNLIVHASANFYSDWYNTTPPDRRSHFGATWWTVRPDPHIRMQILFNSKGSGNNINYINPEVDKLLDEGAGIYDTAKAKKLYGDILTKVTEDAGYIPLFYPTVYWGMTNNVQNFVLIPDYMTRFREMWLGK